MRVFGHDPLRRLVSATGRETSTVYDQPSWDLSLRPYDSTSTNTYTRTYEYDKLGNIQKLGHTADGHANQNFNRTYEYKDPFTDNLLESFAVGSTNYANQYDTSGNLIKTGSDRNYVWGASGKMVAFYNQAGSGNPTVYSWYLYNAQGERVKKVTKKGSVVEVTVYVDGGMFETRYVRPNGGAIDNSRNYNLLNVKDGSSLLAFIQVGTNSPDTTPKIKYSIANHLDNSNVLVDSSGILINREEYYPFGETSFGSFGYKRYRYNGKEKDEHTGLYEYGQRYYAPWLCRFVSVDPIAEDYPQYTSYNYAGNKPISKRDLEGLQEEDAPANEGSGASTGSNTYNADPNDISALPVDVQDAINQVGVGDNIEIYQTEGAFSVSIKYANGDTYQSISETDAATETTEFSSALEKMTIARGAEVSYNSFSRDPYKKKIQNYARNAEGLIVPESDHATNKLIAKGAYDYRNTTRTTTQNKLTPVGKVFSETIESTRELTPFNDMYEKKGATGTIRSSGKSSRVGNIASSIGKTLGTAGLIYGTNQALSRIIEAPEGLKDNVAYEELTTFAGSLAGSVLAAGLVVLAFSNPVGWVALAAVAGASIVGGYIGGEFGHSVGRMMRNDGNQRQDIGLKL